MHPPNMLPTSLLLLCLATLGASAESSEADITYSQTFSTITTNIPTSAFTGSQYTYLSNTGQSTVTSSSTRHLNHTSSSASRNSQITVSSSSVSLTVIGGITSSRTLNGTFSTASSTTSSAQPTNTVPCNGYPEFCNRQYSNITNVCSHNSAFVVKNNAGSNQQLSVLTQLNDGIRMLQGETHYVNDTIYSCHTNCSLLNAGPWQNMLEDAAGWLQENPYEVLTILIVNSDFTSVENYVAPITNAGLLDYVYYPEFVPQRRNQWPTLGEMILKNQRLVIFMDYQANQTSVPYILDEFTHMWETPFSPTNQNFPCTQERPPGLNQTEARDDYMYLANHNLNVAIDISAILGGNPSESSTILIPDTARIQNTNGQYNTLGQLGAASINCTANWTRPPNFLLVDYYNYGDPGPGSVFEVAAAANGVTYNQKCCGTVSAASGLRASFVVLIAALSLAFIVGW